jgi:hypothetical protein
MGFVVDSGTEAVLSVCFGFPCQFSVHRLLHTVCHPGQCSKLLSGRGTKWAKPPPHRHTNKKQSSRDEDELGTRKRGRTCELPGPPSLPSSWHWGLCPQGVKLQEREANHSPTHLHLVPRSTRMELYLRSPIYIHGVWHYPIKQCLANQAQGQLNPFVCIKCSRLAGIESWHYCT